MIWTKFFFCGTETPFLVRQVRASRNMYDFLYISPVIQDQRKCFLPFRFWLPNIGKIGPRIWGKSENCLLKHTCADLEKLDWYGKRYLFYVLRGTHMTIAVKGPLLTHFGEFDKRAYGWKKEITPTTSVWGINGPDLFPQARLSERFRFGSL